MAPGTTVHALCHDDFYDALIAHPQVRATYLNWLRSNTAYQSFPYGGITFHNYRGTDDASTVAIAAGKAKFFPVGAPGVFKVALSPAEFFDYVNTPGLDLYAMTIPDRERNAWSRSRSAATRCSSAPARKCCSGQNGPERPMSAFAAALDACSPIRTSPATASTVRVVAAPACRSGSSSTGRTASSRTAKPAS